MRNSTLILYCDNLPAVFMLKKWASKSVECYKLVLRIYELLQLYNIWLEIKWVCSADNFADFPSRAHV